MRITKLERAPEGHWTANLTSDDGQTFPVHNRYGAWFTQPGDGGVMHDVLPHAAAALQTRLRAAMRNEPIDETEEIEVPRQTIREAVEKSVARLRGKRIAKPAEEPTPVTALDPKRVAAAMAKASYDAAREAKEIA